MNTQNQTPTEPQNEQDHKLVTFENYIPEQDPENPQAVAVITSSYEEAEAWGATEATAEELSEILGNEG